MKRIRATRVQNSASATARRCPTHYTHDAIEILSKIEWDVTKDVDTACIRASPESDCRRFFRTLTEAEWSARIAPDHMGYISLSAMGRCTLVPSDASVREVLCAVADIAASLTDSSCRRHFIGVTKESAVSYSVDLVV